MNSGEQDIFQFKVIFCGVFMLYVQCAYWNRCQRLRRLHQSSVYRLGHIRNGYDDVTYVHKMFALPEMNFKQKHSLSVGFCCVVLCSLHLILECFHLKICFRTETDTFCELMCLYFTTFVNGFHFKRPIWRDFIFSIQMQAFEFIENFTLISNVIVNNVFSENDQNCSLFVVRLLKSSQASIYCLSRHIICCIECVSWRHIPMWKIPLHRNVLFSWCQLFTIDNTISMDFQHNTKPNFVSFIALCIQLQDCQS